MIIGGIFGCNTVIFPQIGGIVNITGTLCPYLVSYFNSKDPTIFSSDVLVTASIAYFFEALSFLLISFLSTRFTELTLLIASLLLCSASLFICSFITSPYLFFAVFGTTIGVISTPFGYLPTWIGWKRTDESIKGLIAGVGSGSYVLSPLIYGVVFTLIVNPENYPSFTVTATEMFFDQRVYDNVPWALRVFSIIVLGTGILSCFLLSVHSEKTLERRNDSTLTLGKLLRQWNFWYLFVLMFFNIFFYQYLLSNYKNIGLRYIRDDYFIAYISTVAFITCAGSKVINGILLDKFSWRGLNIWSNCLQLILCGTMSLILEYKYLYGIWLTVSLCLSGSSFVSVWILSSRIYPKDNWVISLIALSLILDMFLVNFIQGFITPVISYIGNRV